MTRPMRTVRWLLIWLGSTGLIASVMLVAVGWLIVVAVEYEQRHALVSVAAAVGALALLVKALPPVFGMVGEILSDLWQAVRARRW